MGLLLGTSEACEKAFLAHFCAVQSFAAATPMMGICTLPVDRI
jgi:hypothetical protein